MGWTLGGEGLTEDQNRTLGGEGPTDNPRHQGRGRGEGAPPGIEERCTNVDSSVAESNRWCRRYAYTCGSPAPNMSRPRVGHACAPISLPRHKFGAAPVAPPPPLGGRRAPAQSVTQKSARARRTRASKTVLTARAECQLPGGPQPVSGSSVQGARAMRCVSKERRPRRRSPTSRGTAVPAAAPSAKV